MKNQNGETRERVKENIKEQVTKLMEAIRYSNDIEVAVKRSPDKITGESRIDPAGSGWIIDIRNIGKYLTNRQIPVINPNLKVPNMKPGEFVGKVVSIAELLALNYDTFNRK